MRTTRMPASGRARSLALLLLPIGLIALAAGVGLGPRHYAEEGLTGTAATGAVLLVAGAALVIWGTIRVLASMRRRWWTPVVLLVLVATFLSSWTLGQAVAAAYAPRPDLGERTPADLGVAFSDVTFPSGDGVELAGWYVPSRNGAAVIAFPGGAMRCHAEYRAIAANGPIAPGSAVPSSSRKRRSASQRCWICSSISGFRC